MASKTLKLAIGLLLLLIIVIFLWNEFYPSSKSTDIISNSGQNLTELFKNDEVLKGFIDEQPELSPEYYKCLAVVNKDVKICNNSTNSSECKKVFYFHYFFGNESYCSSPDNIDDDYKTICSAFHSKNQKLCASINNAYNRNFCEAATGNIIDISHCDSSPETSECQEHINLMTAILNKDLNKCQDIEEHSGFCEAVVLQNDSYCNKFIRDYLRKFWVKK